MGKAFNRTVQPHAIIAALKGRARVCGHEVVCQEQVEEMIEIFESALNESLRARDETIRQYANALRQQRKVTEILQQIVQNRVVDDVEART